MITSEQFIQWAGDQVETYRAAVANFARALARAVADGSAARQLENCDRAFEYAARLEVMTSCLAWVTKHGSTMEALKARAIECVYDGALSGTGSRSTSTTGNWMAQCRVAAWADVVTVLGCVK